MKDLKLFSLVWEVLPSLAVSMPNVLLPYFTRFQAIVPGVSALAPGGTGVGCADLAVTSLPPSRCFSLPPPLLIHLSRSLTAPAAAEVHTWRPYAQEGPGGGWVGDWRLERRVRAGECVNKKVGGVEESCDMPPGLQRLTDKTMAPWTSPAPTRLLPSSVNLLPVLHPLYFTSYLPFGFYAIISATSFVSTSCSLVGCFAENCSWNSDSCLGC